MLKTVFAASLLMVSSVVAVNTNAANMIYSQAAELRGDELFTPQDILSWVAVGSHDLGELSQFDTSIGVLNSVTLSIVGSLKPPGHSSRLLVDWVL